MKADNLIEIAQDIQQILGFKEHNTRFHQQILSECFLSVVDGELLIYCPNCTLAKALRVRIAHLQEAAKQASISLQKPIYRITAITVEGRAWSLPVPCDRALINKLSEQRRRELIMSTADQGIIAVPDQDLINEILGYEGACTLLRFYDDAPIFSNTRTELCSGSRPNDWMKVKDHSVYWVGDEIKNYKTRLLQDISLTGYSYIARFFNGQLHRYTVDARLVLYRGDLCRLVKNKSIVPIEY